MRQHGYVTIKDLMYNTKESLDRIIVKKNGQINSIQKFKKLGEQRENHLPVIRI